MTIQRDPTGRRSIKVETEVPGAPEEVWDAIATGPGVSSWFCATEIEPRVGGAARCRPPHAEGPELEEFGRVTRLERPRRFSTESPLGPGAPTMAGDWTVEPRGAGRCLVRVTHSLVTQADDWDEQLESVELGWPTFFCVLRLYLTHFRARPASIVASLGSTAGSAEEAWGALCGALGIVGVSAGERRELSFPGLPGLSGVVEDTRAGRQPWAVFRLEPPTPGIALAGAFAMEGRGMAHFGIYRYGDEAAALAARDEPRLREWMRGVFPG